MTTWSLPVRISCAVVALPVAGAAGFYVAMSLLTKFEGMDADAFATFATALAIGAVVGFTASLVALTQPGIRPRRRTGRPGRSIFTAVFAGIVCAGFAADSHSLVFDLALLVWLSYTMAYTYVRYGVLDPPKKKATPAPAS